MSRSSADEEKRVLVVEDHRDLATAMQFALVALGHVVQVVGDGEAGLAAVQSFGPDIVLVDLALPVMNGWTLARRIRQLGLPVPPRLIAVTGFGQPAHVARSRAAGFERHIVKPIYLDDLRRIVERPITN